MKKLNTRPHRLVITLLGFMVFGGCVATEDAPSFFLKGNAAVTQQEQCVARDNPRLYRPGGVMDTWITNRYKMFPIMENYLEPTKGNDEFGPLYAEVHNIQLLGVSVTYEYPTNLSQATKDVLGEEHFHAMGGFVLAGDPGVSIVDILQPEVGEVLREELHRFGGFEIVANVEIEGRLSDGTILHTNTMYYPIKVCYQCLVMDIVSDPTDLGDAQDMRPPCVIGQDDGIDSRVLFALGYDLSELLPKAY
jgi:hypothetical protein